MSNMSFDDPETWSLFKEGRTKGVFQLESNLGRSWSKKLAPANLEELSALIALIRPGCVSGGASILCRSTKGKLLLKTLRDIHSIGTQAIGSIISYDKDKDKFVDNVVLDVIFRGHKEVFKVIAIDLTSPKQIRFDKLKCTSDHKLLTPTGWVELQNLNVGDRIASVIDRKLGIISWAEYYGCSSCGDMDTYDISMKAPHHNFIADDMVVHNCLQAVTDGKSMTQHYVDRKHNRDEITYLHDSLKDILDKTQGVIVYQEQAMLIAQKLAGFNSQESDVLRKAIGKKDADLMSETGTKFIEGCKKTGIVNEDVAKEIFSWIAKSARYLFNKSHSVSYAVNSYMSAWYKAKHTREFFLSYLYHSSEKLDPHQEVAELVSEAKLFNIEVKTPNIVKFGSKFNIDKDIIYFGLKDVKSLTGKTGDSVIEAINKLEEGLKKPAKEWSWMDILICLGAEVNSIAFKTLASIGFFTTLNTKITRNKAVYEYEIFKALKEPEKTWISENYKEKGWTTLIDCFTDLIEFKKLKKGVIAAGRVQFIENEKTLLANPPYDLTDDPAWIIDQEIKFLGCPISLAKIETSDTSSANTSCKDLANGKTGDKLCVAANINRLVTIKVKNGKSAGKLMSFLTIEDETCSIDNAVIFPESREKYEMTLYEGNNLLFCGSTSKKDGSFIIDKIFEI